MIVHPTPFEYDALRNQWLTFTARLTMTDEERHAGPRDFVGLQVDAPDHLGDPVTVVAATGPQKRTEPAWGSPHRGKPVHIPQDPGGIRVTFHSSMRQDAAQQAYAFWDAWGRERR